MVQSDAEAVEARCDHLTPLEIKAVHEENVSLRERIGELEAVLAPFSAAFDHLPEYALAHDPQCIWDTDAAQQIKVSDLRRARSMLREIASGDGK